LYREPTGDGSVRIRVAVLDMAGTIVHEEGVVEEAFREALISIGSTLPRDLHERLHRARGGSKLAMFADILDGNPELSARAHTAFEDELVRAIDSWRIAPIEGAVEALADLKEMDVSVAITTGFSRRVREHLLATLGWSALADLVLSPEDVGRGRPHPDLVLTALLRLGGEDVREAAVVGDTVNDLIAGTRAGASIVAGVLTGAHSRLELEKAPHTHIIDSIAQFPALVVPAS
jgi:phosphoglycolate phosphatase